MALGGGDKKFKSAITNEFLRPINEFTPLNGYLSAGGVGVNPNFAGVNPYFAGANPYLAGVNPYFAGANPYFTGANSNLAFRLEPARCGNGLCHIKCCGTNKYLQVRSAEPTNTSWITADADATNEDQTCLTCTFFEIERFGTGPTKTIRLRHRHLNRYACLHKLNDAYPSCLCALSQNTDKDSMDVFVYSESN